MEIGSWVPSPYDERAYDVFVEWAGTETHPRVLPQALIALAQHPDTHPAARGRAGRAVRGRGRGDLRVHAVFGLAERDDPRCLKGSGRMGTVVDPERYGYGVLDAARRYEDRLAGRGSGWRWRRG